MMQIGALVPWVQNCVVIQRGFKMFSWDFKGKSGNFLKICMNWKKKINNDHCGDFTRIRQRYMEVIKFSGLCTFLSILEIRQKKNHLHNGNFASSFHYNYCFNLCTYFRKFPSKSRKIDYLFLVSAFHRDGDYASMRKVKNKRRRRKKEEGVLSSKQNIETFINFTYKTNQCHIWCLFLGEELYV